MWCAAGNHNYMSHVCAKGFLDLNFNQAVIDKISNLLEIAQNFTYISLYFFPMNSMAGTCRECTFSFLPVVSR